MQKQKKFLIIAGLIFLCSAVYLAHGLTTKAQTICLPLGDVCVVSDINNNCCSPYGCDPLDNICKPMPFLAPPPSICSSFGKECVQHIDCCSLNCVTNNVTTKGACALALGSGNSPVGPGGGFSAPGLVVSYPNGGESWQIGQIYQIKWRTQVILNAVEIKIWNSDYTDQLAPQAYKIIASSTKGTQGAIDQTGVNMSYPWEIQSNFFDSNGIWKPIDRLKIVITEKRTDGLPASQDQSDGYLNVVPAPVPIKKCADCGNGIFNLCSKDECFAIDPHCAFNSTIIGGTCSSNGCTTDQECNTIIGCGSDYLSKCNTQNRRCSCVPAITEQKISFKVMVNNSTGPSDEAISQATVKVFNSQSQQVGSCATATNGICTTNELVPIGYGSIAFPTKSYSAQVSAQGFLTNSTINFNATLNMPPVNVTLYRNSQTTFNATIDLYNHYDEITSGGVIEKIYPFWGVHIGIRKIGESTTLQECFAINPPKKCSFSLENGSYRVFVTDYQFCGLGEGCFTDFEVNNSDLVAKLITKMQKVTMSKSPYCSRTDGGDEYTKGAIRYLTSSASGYNSAQYAIDECKDGNTLLQYNCNGWPQVTACPNGCYDGACLIDCSKLSSTLGGFCTKESQLATVCGADEIKNQSIGDSFCNKTGGNFCAICSRACTPENVTTNCSYLNCPYNQTKVSETACGSDSKCFCRNLSCSQDSNCANITCANSQTPICDVKSFSGASPILLKECFCLNNISQKRILVHVDDRFTTEDLPGILVSILDKGVEVASCVTDANKTAGQEPRGKCTIPALTFSQAHDYVAVVQGAPGYKDEEIKLFSRNNSDFVSANFHLQSNAAGIVPCAKNSECDTYTACNTATQFPTCFGGQCACWDKPNVPSNNQKAFSVNLVGGSEEGGLNVVANPFNIALSFSEIQKQCPTDRPGFIEPNGNLTEQLSPGKIASIQLTKSGSCAFKKSGTPLGDQSKKMTKGWNAVAVNAIIAINEIKGDCAIKGAYYKVGGTQKNITNDEKLNPLLGYFIEVAKDCQFSK